MANTSNVFKTVQVPALAERVTSVPGVACLDGGKFGEFSTYLPTEMVRGVSFNMQTSRLKVAIAIYWPHPPRAVAEAVRTALAPLVSAPIDVYINDMVLPEAGNASSSAPQPQPQPQLAQSKEN